MNIFSSLKPIHLDGRKDKTSHDAVLDYPKASIKDVYLSITNPRGVEIVLEKNVGDDVFVGTRIGVRQDFYVPIFSPISGKIVEKVMLYNPSVGRPTAHYRIENDQQYVVKSALNIMDSESTQADIIAAIKEAGIIGLGGAGFPAYIKYEGAVGKDVDYVLINGVECEPYLSTDYHAAQRDAEALMQGTELLRRAANAKQAVIAFKQTKVAIKDAITPFLDRYPHIHIRTTPDVYPMGWEKTLIRQLFKRDYVKLPIEAKIVVNNLTTAIHVAKALYEGLPILERVLTVSGEGMNHPGNVRVPIGVKMNEIVQFLGGYSMDLATAFVGGPMSSKSVTDDQFAVQPQHGGFTVLAPVSSQEEACLRCGACTAACPAFIQPIEIKNALDRNNTERLLKLDPMKCIECGLCTYVCPSKIEVTEAVRNAKLKVRLELTRQGQLKARP
jgi:Na+-translocating ferredoxin:NAD+ oxidoreductase subunit C